VNCQEFVPALDPYLDDELSVLEVLRMQGHLLVCDRCRTMLESEAALHALLAADAVQDDLPPGLRDGILDRVRGASSGPVPLPSARRHSTAAHVLLAGLALVALVALLLVALLVPRVWRAGDMPPFAAEVAAKHRVYTEPSGPPLDLTTTDIQQLTASLERRVGFPVKAPRLVESGQHLVGGRVSSVADAPAAYLRYEWGGRPLSLFVIPPLPPARARGTEQVIEGVELYTARVSGITLVWWEDAERLYVAASTGSLTDLEAFAVLCVRSGPLDRSSDDPPAAARHG
jgi:anti-sigma factor RsiW